MKQFKVHPEIPSYFKATCTSAPNILQPKDVGVSSHGEGLSADHCGVAVEADRTGARSKDAGTCAERRGWPW